MAEVIERAVNVHKWYVLGQTRVHALRGVSIDVREGEFVFIVGPSGSGKSTLLHILGALDRPSRGHVYFMGRDISQMDDLALSLLRRKRIGFIFQTFNLLPNLSAVENVILPLIPTAISADEARKKAIRLLSEVGLKHRAHHTPAQLSGGECQRVAIARALVNDPAIVLADEPTGELDSKTGGEVMAYMRRLNRKHGKTFVIVTHDVEYIRKGDTVYQLKDGRFVNP